MATTIKKAAQVREILQEACARREMLILVTPYLRYESTFAGLDNNLIAPAEKLYDETAEWQASGIGAPSSVSGLIGDYCVSMLWRGTWMGRQ